MKLSLWQQFSSNHSSSFTVVGEFASHAEAEAAATQIRQILTNLSSWHSEHEDEMRDWWSSGDWADEPSPPEKELAQQYNIEWRGAIDWFGNARVDIVFDRFIYITPGQRPEADGQPFDQLINRLGGKGYHEGDIYSDDTGWILFNLTCQSPDEQTAAAIYKRYLGFNRRIKRDGTQLQFYKWRFDEEPNLTTLIKNLEADGCNGIQFDFQQVIPDDNIKLHGADDLEVLIDVLNNVTDSEDRERAAEVLGDIGDGRAVDPLIKALSSSDEDVQRAAVRALGDLKDRRAVDPLIKLLSDKTRLWTKSFVIRSLGEIADPRAIQPLISQLRDQDARPNIIAVLGRLGAPAIEPLQHALANASEQDRSSIEQALQLVNDTVKYGQALTLMRNSDESIAHNAFEQVLASGNVESMLAYLRNHGANWNSTLPQRVIDALIERKEARLVPLLVDYFSQYGQLAITAFEKIGSSAVDALLQLANTHKESWIRDSAFHALTRIGDPRTYNLLIEGLDSRDNIRRQNAAMGLGKLGDRRAIQPLIQAYFQSGERWYPEAERSIFLSIQELGGQPELVDALIQRLQTSGNALYGTIYLLGQIGDKRAVEPLQNLMGSVHKEMQKLIEEALQKIASQNSS